MKCREVCVLFSLIVSVCLVASASARDWVAAKASCCGPVFSASGPSGQLVARSNRSIARIKDVDRFNDCGPLHSVSLDTCNGPVAVDVKSPRNSGPLLETETKGSGRSATLKFANGDHVHVRINKKTNEIEIDLDD
jgi:hypothetical protein